VFLLPTHKYLFNRFSALGLLLKTSFEKVRFSHITSDLPMTIPTKRLTATSVALLGNSALPSFSTKQNVSFADTFFLLPTYKYLFNSFSALGFLLKTSFEKVF